MLLTPAVALGVAGLAIAYALTTGKGSSEVLFSGQSALGPFISSGGAYPLGAVLALILCKSLGYSLSISSFRGGLVFPSLFIGAAGGVALSHFPGLPLVAAVAMGMGAMSAVMLRLPMTSALLPSVFLQSDGLAVVPLVITSVVVAHVAASRFERP